MDGFDHLVRAQLKSRSADIGVIVYDPDSILEGVDCRPVATEQLCLIGSTPPAIPPGPVHLAKIAGLPLILPSGQNILRRRLDLAFRRAHLSPDIIEVDSYQLLTDLIHQSRGYTIAPSCFVARRREDQYWWSPINNLSTTLAIAVQEARARSPAVAAVVDPVMVADRDVGRGSRGKNVRRVGSSWAHTASIHRLRVLSRRRSSSTGAHHFDPGIVGKRRSGAEEADCRRARIRDRCRRSPSPRSGAPTRPKQSSGTKRRQRTRIGIRFAMNRGSQVRNGLSGGGNRIRTIGPSRGASLWPRQERGEVRVRILDCFVVGATAPARSTLGAMRSRPPGTQQRRIR